MIEITFKSEVTGLLKIIDKEDRHGINGSFRAVINGTVPGCLDSSTATLKIKFVLSLNPKNGADFLVRPPGFEPGSPAWQADVLARLDYGRDLLGVSIRLIIIFFESQCSSLFVFDQTSF